MLRPQEREEELYHYSVLSKAGQWRARVPSFKIRKHLQSSMVVRVAAITNNPTISGIKTLKNVFLTSEFLSYWCFRTTAGNEQLQLRSGLFSCWDPGWTRCSYLWHVILVAVTNHKRNRWWKCELVLEAADGTWHISCSLTFLGQSKSPAKSKSTRLGCLMLPANIALHIVN